MIKLFIWLMITVVVMAGIVFFKKTEKKKTYIIAIGSLLTAAVALWMQGSFAWHMSLLAILGLSLVTALLFMKIEEREQQEKLRLKEERKELKKQPAANSQPSKTVHEEPVQKQESKTEKSEKVFGMESIGPVGKGN
ncbi:hypothetical protein [Planococcus maritimus]|uniref:hypothetical protein n=1 Tax=Planococcus maritimus TaxID=192421 RepID=UPI00232EDD3F|nr:hypothetical protein [Planococcus maritimus]